MASLVLTIKSARTDLANRLVPDTSLSKQAFQKYVTYFRSLMGGLESGTVSAQVSSSDPVAASGTITITHANLSAGATVTIGGVVLTAESSGANGTTQFNIGTDATSDATNLAACINANPTLSGLVSASHSSGVVTVSCLVLGAIGNLVTMATSASTAFALVQLSGGTGGAAGSATSYSA